MLAYRVAAVGALFVACAGLVSGCSDEESKAGPGSSSKPSPLPENLCEPILAAVSADWGLGEDTHATEAPTAVCELTGPGDSLLRVTLTDLPDRDAAAAALDLVCRTAVGVPLGSDQRRCELATERVAGRPFALAHAASYAESASVVVLQLTTSDDTVALAAPAELATIEAALQDR